MLVVWCRYCYNVLNMSSFSHIAILGRQPEFGLVELESLLGADAMRPFGRRAALVSSPPPIAQLGGTIKLVEIWAQMPAAAVESMVTRPEIVQRLAGNAASKVVFGISVYGTQSDHTVVTRVGLVLKRQLQQVGRSVRYVAPKGRATELTAAQLKFNRMLEHGYDVCVVTDGEQAIVGRTASVQDIDWYAARDYGRPARSAKVGMLPPKLAQILVNTVSGSIYDPFCGTGVVLQEGLLAGRNVMGSDLDTGMVDASRANLKWLAGVSRLPSPVESRGGRCAPR